MATRPLTDKEKEGFRLKLEVAKKRLKEVHDYIVYLEEELKGGTAWASDPAELEQMWKEAEEIAHKDQKRRKQKK